MSSCRGMPFPFGLFYVVESASLPRVTRFDSIKVYEAELKFQLLAFFKFIFGDCVIVVVLAVVFVVVVFLLFLLWLM